MPGKSEILEALYRGSNFNDCIHRVAPEELRNDLRQEIILRLCEQTEEKIVGLHERGELEFYTVRIILNEFRNKSNGFAKKYRSVYSELSEKEMAEETDFKEREMKEKLEEYTLAEIDNLYWYNRDLVRLYMKVGTIRAIEKITKIPRASCHRTIKESLAALKRRATEPAARPDPLFTKQELSIIAGMPAGVNTRL